MSAIETAISTDSGCRFGRRFVFALAPQHAGLESGTFFVRIIIDLRSETVAGFLRCGEKAKLTKATRRGFMTHSIFRLGSGLMAAMLIGMMCAPMPSVAQTSNVGCIVSAIYTGNDDARSDSAVRLQIASPNGDTLEDENVKKQRITWNNNTAWSGRLRLENPVSAFQPVIVTLSLIQHPRGFEGWDYWDVQGLYVSLFGICPKSTPYQEIVGCTGGPCNPNEGPPIIKGAGSQPQSNFIQGFGCRGASGKKWLRLTDSVPTVTITLFGARRCSFTPKSAKAS
jgi:hypothetical protein